MSRQSAIIVDLGEYRRQRQARENAAQDRAGQPGAPLMWCWVWLIPVAGPVMQARA